MSSKIMMLSLFAVAGLNLSFWGVSARAQSNNNCGQIGSQLSESAQAQCQISTKRFGRDAKSNVVVKKQIEKAEDGKEKVVGYNVEITTEAGCKGCGVRSNEALRDNLSFPATENLADINSQISDRAADMGKEAMANLTEQIKLQKGMEKCLVGEDGENLDAEEKQNCKIEKLSSLDDEEAEEYFEKNLKEELLTKLNSADPAEREKARAMLETLSTEALSDGLEKEVKALITQSKQAEMVQQKLAQDIAGIQAMKQRAELTIMTAEAIPVGTPGRDQAIARAQQEAQQMVSGMEQQIATLKYQTLSTALRTGQPADTTYADTMKAAFDTTINSSPTLLKTKTLMGDVTNAGSSIDNVNNASRLQRGNGVKPLIVIPQTNVHPNAMQLDLPNAVNSGELRQGQNRMPSPILQQQFQTVNNVQPVPTNQLNGQVYQWNQPFANQTGMGGAPVMTLPLN